MLHHRLATTRLWLPRYLQAQAIMLLPVRLLLLQQILAPSAIGVFGTRARRRTMLHASSSSTSYRRCRPRLERRRPLMWSMQR